MNDDIEALRRERDAWQETANFHAGNEAFYRNIVCGIGAMFGKAAYTADDGTVMQDVLALKVPELVKELVYVAWQTANHFDGTDAPLGKRARDALSLEADTDPAERGLG